MKNYNKIILYCGLFFFLAGSFTSCTDFLDIKSGATINPDDSYKNFTSFQGFTEELYNCIPSFCNRDDNNFFNNGEEEMWQANATNQGAWVWQVDIGNFRAWQRGGFGNGGSFLDQNTTNFSTDNNKQAKSVWAGSWYGIRKCNIGLANLDKMVDATQQQKDLIAGQLYFFRAWFHLQIITYWGGMPYIDEVLPSDKPLRLPRLTYQKTADKIALDFQKAYELLPGNWDDFPGTVQEGATNGKNELRINKWMAIAYLGKNYLYAGSPLMNKSSGGGESYNAEYCKKAADAFGILLNAVDNGTCQYKLIPWGTNGSGYEQNYRTFGQNNRMPGSADIGGVKYLEAIFRGPNYGGTGQSMDKEYLCAGVLQDRSWSQYPTANYVNYFGMNNGMPINSVSKADVDDPTSGYDTHYPWKNRDPRFYLNFGFDTRKMVNSTGTAQARQYTYANLYDGTNVGNYRVERAKGSNTGYLLMKFNPLGYNKYDNAYNAHQVHIPWMRLSDVYLMYSESVAMGYNNINATSTTWSKNAVQSINIVRDRVKLPNGNGLPGVNAAYLTSVDKFMSEVRRERAVELAYEGHRFNDLRRWLLLTKAPYTYKTGIKFDRDIKETNDVTPTNIFLDKVNPENNKINNLKEYIVLERLFTDKHYWLPLKNSDASIYLEFAQNPGW